MSKATAIQFIHKVGGDSSLQQRIQGLNGNVAGLLTVAAETGYAFSQDEWNSAVAELADSMMGELSEQDLDNVAGGAAVDYYVPAGNNSFSWGMNFLPPNVSLYYYAKPGM